MTPFGEPVEIPITDVFDLHSIPARDAKAAAEACLEAAYERGFATCESFMAGESAFSGKW